MPQTLLRLHDAGKPQAVSRNLGGDFLGRHPQAATEGPTIPLFCHSLTSALPTAWRALNAFTTAKITLGFEAQVVKCMGGGDRKIHCIFLRNEFSSNFGQDLHGNFKDDSGGH